MKPQTATSLFTTTFLPNITLYSLVGSDRRFVQTCCLNILSWTLEQQQQQQQQFLNRQYMSTKPAGLETQKTGYLTHTTAEPGARSGVVGFGRTVRVRKHSHMENSTCFWGPPSLLLIEFWGPPSLLLTEFWGPSSLLLTEFWGPPSLLLTEFWGPPSLLLTEFWAHPTSFWQSSGVHPTPYWQSSGSQPVFYWQEFWGPPSLLLTEFWGPPSLLLNGDRVFSPGVKLGVTSTLDLYLLSSSRMNGANFLLPHKL